MQHKVLWILCMLLLLTAAGCKKVGPDFRQPPVPMQEGWIDGGTKHIHGCDLDELCAWWRVFKDPYLDELMGLARAENYNVRIACMRILEARAMLGIAIGEWFPQKQDAVGSVLRYRLSANAPNIEGANLKFKDYNLGGFVAWEMDFWGKFRRAIEAADEELFASVANFNDVLVLLYAEVASNYVQIRTIEAQIAILKSNVQIQQRSLEIVDARFQAGMVTELDLRQAEALLRDTEARIPALEISLRVAQNALAVLLGMTPKTFDDSFAFGGNIPEAPITVAAGIPAQLICRRPDIQRALFEAGAQCARIGVAIADLYPHFSLTGYVGVQSSASTTSSGLGVGGKFFSSKSFNYFFGPDYAWALFNYGRIGNNIRVQYARFYELVSHYQNAVLIAYQDVENALVRFARSHDRVELLQLSTKAAQRAVDLSNTQYVEGIADYTRVLNTEQVLLDAQEELVISQGEIAQGLIDTYKALGGGWQWSSTAEWCEEDKKLSYFFE